MLLTHLCLPSFSQPSKGQDGGVPPTSEGGFSDLINATKWHRADGRYNPSGEVERFLKDCKKRFDDLWKRFGEAEKLRRVMADSSLTSEQHRQAQQDYKKYLKKVARSAGGLRSRMISLLRGFEDKKDLDWQQPFTGESSQPYRSEMEFIRKYIREAEDRFYGRQAHVVCYDEENILVCLYWVEQMAKQIRADLEG